MFIAHVAVERSLASKKRNVPLTKPHISLLRSFSVLWDPGSINIWSLRDRKNRRPKNRQTLNCENFRDTLSIWLRKNSYDPLNYTKQHEGH